MIHRRILSTLGVTAAAVSLTACSSTPSYPVESEATLKENASVMRQFLGSYETCGEAMSAANREGLSGGSSEVELQMTARNCSPGEWIAAATNLPSAIGYTNATEAEAEDFLWTLCMSMVDGEDTDNLETWAPACAGGILNRT